MTKMKLHKFLDVFHWIPINQFSIHQLPSHLLEVQIPINQSLIQILLIHYEFDYQLIDYNLSY